MRVIGIISMKERTRKLISKVKEIPGIIINIIRRVRNIRSEMENETVFEGTIDEYLLEHLYDRSMDGMLEDYFNLYDD